MVLTSAIAFSQQTIRGEVKDDYGSAIPNVQVGIEGTNLFTQTNSEGEFTIEIPSQKGTLTFFAEGYHPFKREVSSTMPLVYVTMKDGSKEIKELVISAQKRLEVNKLNIKNIDAPMTINVLNNSALQKWDINTFEEASTMIAGVNSIRQYGGFQGFNIRGFNDFVVFYDGVRDERHSFFSTAPMGNLANIERVEVLKGPSGDMFGHSALGGIINIVRKKPTYTTHGDAKFTIGSYKTYNAALGIGGPISDKLRYRIDAATLNTEGFRGVEDKMANISVMLHYTPSARSKFEIFYQYQNNHFGPDTGIPATNEGKVLYPWINPMSNFANPLDYLKQKSHEFYVKFRYDFMNKSHLDYKISYTDDDYDYLMDEVLFVDDASRRIYRANYGGYHFNRKNRALVSQLDYTFGFRTFGFKHKIIVGNVSYHLDKPNYYGDISVIGSDANVIGGGLGEKRLTIARKQMIDEFSSALYFQDWMEFSDRFKILLGGRYDYISGNYGERGNVKEQLPAEKIEVNNFTYRGAVSIQPIRDFMTIYGSASTFFKPTRTHDHRTGKIFKPERGLQIEAGLKIEKKNKVNATLSGFYIEKKNLIVGHNVRTQVGKAISRGFEVDADAELTKGLYLKLGYAFTDAFFAKQTPEKGSADISHNKTPWTPKHAVSAWMDFEPQKTLKGFGLGFGVFYTDKTYQNQFNDQFLPAYTLFNGSIYYQTKKNLRLGINVENIFNKLYYHSALSSNDLWYMETADAPYMSPMQMYPGKSRNYKFTVSYSF